MSTFDAKGGIDRPVIVTCLGRKGSGKSMVGLLLFESYPHDRVVIDIAGDDGPTEEGTGNRKDDPIHTLKGDVSDLPERWPDHLRERPEQRLTLRYVPNPTSTTYLEDMDAVIGMAYRHGRCAILIHEIHEIAPSNRTPPHMRRLLRQSRHRDMTEIGCGPRAAWVDRLQLAQSDLVYIFELPDPDDRAMVAKVIGVEPKLLDERIRALKKHQHVLFDANADPPEHEGEEDLRLQTFDALPEEEITYLKRWAGKTN
jgi:hypothetical protein